MLDIESLDLTPECVILTIGAVSFDPRGNGILERLLLKPTIEDQTEVYNRKIDDGTINWWAEQNPQALEEALGEEGRMSLHDCMEQLYQFCWNRNCVWSNGASYDIVCCESAFRQALTEYTNPIPWQFYKVRDTRTLYEIANVKLKDGGYVTKHSAADDAERQAIVVQQAYMKLMKAGLVQPR